MSFRFHGLANLLLVIVLANNPACGSAAMKVREKTVVGHELRLVVETSRTEQPIWSHTSTTSDVKGYLVVVNLASSLPVEQRSRVYGPLWDVPQPRSGLSYDAGANFTKADDDAAVATPHLGFDENGEPVRFRINPAQTQVLFDRLDLATATYKDFRAFKPIDDRLAPMSEDEVVSTSGRYLLLYQHNVARLYDLYTGQEKADKWLTDRFAESRRIPKFENVRTFLTDDLDHLVVSPRAIWNEGFGAPIHETFDFGGKTLSRAEYFLCADRPERSLALVKRNPDQREFLNEAPDGVFTIDHRLMLMYSTHSAIRLYRRDGAVAYHSDARVPGGWRNGAFGTRHLASEGKMVFFTIDLERQNWDQIMDRHVAFNIWDYRHNTVSSHEVSVVDLFREVLGHYVPSVKLIPLTDGKHGEKRDVPP